MHRSCARVCVSELIRIGQLIKIIAFGAILVKEVKMEFKGLHTNDGISLEAPSCTNGKKGEYQGRGIGRRLVEAFWEQCQRSGVKVRVVIREDDERLVAFWTSVGFQRGNLVSYER